MKKKPLVETEFDEFWKETAPIFSSCKPASKYSAILAWNTALDHAIQLMRDRREDQCIPELEDMKATL